MRSRLRLGTLDADELELGVGEKVELEVELYASDGLGLLAPEGVTWQVGDESIAIVSAWLIGMGKEVDAGRGITVEAKAEGTTDVSVVAPGLELAIPVNVSAR